MQSRLNDFVPVAGPPGLGAPSLQTDAGPLLGTTDPPAPPVLPQIRITRPSDSPPLSSPSSPGSIYSNVSPRSSNLPYTGATAGHSVPHADSDELHNILYSGRSWREQMPYEGRPPKQRSILIGPGGSLGASVSTYTAVIALMLTVVSRVAKISHQSNPIICRAEDDTPQCISGRLSYVCSACSC